MVKKPFKGSIRRAIRMFDSPSVKINAQDGKNIGGNIISGSGLSMSKMDLSKMDLTH